MQNLAQLIEDHDTLAWGVKRLTEIASSPEPLAEQAYDQLRIFSDQLDAHLYAEADFIYADEMRKDPSRLDKEIIEFEQEFLDLKNDWHIYLTEWSEESMAVDWMEFSRHTLHMMGRLLERIEKENAVLYPLALQYARIRLRAA